MNLADNFRSIQTSVKAQHVLVSAINGKIDALRRYCSDHAGHRHLDDDMEHLLVQMIKIPTHFQHSRDVLRVLEDNKVNFMRAFDFYGAHTGREADKDIWTMYGRNPLRGTLETAAVLVAEDLRIKFMKSMNYKPDITALVAGDAIDDGVALGLEFSIVATRHTLLGTQNMLVRYVGDEGNKLPVNRGAAMLSILSNDLPPDVSALWTKRMMEIEATTKYSIQKGDIPVARPVYEAFGA